MKSHRPTDPLECFDYKRREKNYNTVQSYSYLESNRIESSRVAGQLLTRTRARLDSGESLLYFKELARLVSCVYSALVRICRMLCCAVARRATRRGRYGSAGRAARPQRSSRVYSAMHCIPIAPVYQCARVLHSQTDADDFKFVVTGRDRTLQYENARRAYSRRNTAACCAQILYVPNGRTHFTSFHFTPLEITSPGGGGGGGGGVHLCAFGRQRQRGDATRRDAERSARRGAARHAAMR